MDYLKDAPFPDTLKVIAERLGVPEEWRVNLPFVQASFERPKRKELTVQFDLKAFSDRDLEKAKYNEIPVMMLRIGILPRGDFAKLALVGGQIALLHHSDWQDIGDALPTQGVFMPYADFVAAWTDYNYHRWERNMLCQALDLPIPAPAVA